MKESNKGFDKMCKMRAFAVESQIQTLPPTPRHRILVLALLAMTLTLCLVLTTTRKDEYRYQPFRSVDLPHVYDRSYPSLALNETLGFEKIFVLNLPARVDRRDMMTLMAHASEFSFDLFTASSGDEIAGVRMPPMNLLPYVTRLQGLTPGQLACYHSNMNIMQHIVKNRIRSALILQDDAEWDIAIRHSLGQLQDPFFTLLDSIGQESARQEQSPEHPWRDAQWDIFWLGANFERPWPQADTAPYVLYEDSNVANAKFAEEGGAKIYSVYGLTRPDAESDPRQRIVQLSRRPLGMAAYAITLAGATKILARANQGIHQSYDNTICSMSRPYTLDGYHGLGCEIANPIKSLGEAELRSYSVWPPIVSQFRSADGIRDSDLVRMRPATFHVDGAVGYALEIRNGVRESILSNNWNW